MTFRVVARFVLATALGAIGAAHLGPLRRGFRIVVPDWATRMLRTDKDTIVVASGVVEIMLAAALLFLPGERRRVGLAIAGLFVAVWPGNIHQWRTGRDAPGLDTDRKRFIRILLQPILIVWALWSTRR
ncbi:DoxX family protein [Microbacterium dauci]|uniref:DoxX family membrane protein n=1 Tax=Microbacterium dauci TaxID=3048008 RepID=A0ABT6ZBA6_9MICO|nr:hypothetical protein [Microbacterium sp. LX3-4]MDJ1113281.1 hypothetical protein [Microbacterium sp. LX3-4]